jgi:uncharacterized protein (DUF779 family)
MQAMNPAGLKAGAVDRGFEMGDVVWQGCEYIAGDQWKHAPQIIAMPRSRGTIFPMEHDRFFKELIRTFFVEFVKLFLPDVARCNRSNPNSGRL